MDLRIVTIAERPDLAEAVWDFPDAWATFMYEDPTANLYYTDAVEAYPEFVMLALSGETVVARSFSVPFTLDGEVAELPAGGWDWVIRRAGYDRFAGRAGTAVSALEITIQREHRGTGLATPMLDAMRRNVARLGFADLVAPVRPSGKPAYPDEPMDVYCRRTRPDGLPEDPWLRLHVRAGGRIVRLCPISMTIPGTLAQWREWTGLPFDTAGPVHVPQALNPVMCLPEHDVAVYVEPNVWVHHKVG